MQVLPLPAFKDNYIWVIREQNRCAVVDPGDAAPVLAWLEAEGVELSAILVTHHHNDHVGGIPELLIRHPVPVFGPSGEPVDTVDHPLQDGAKIRIPGTEIELAFLSVPGHTRQHGAYYGSKRLFCGDTLFGCGCGRLFEGTPAQMHASLTRIAALPDDTLIHCAHEYTEMNLRFALAVEPENPAIRQRAEDTRQIREAGQPSVPSTLALEKATNPFLRWDVPAVRSAASSHAGREISDPVEVFAETRAWRNVF